MKDDEQDICLEVKDLHTSFYTDRGAVRSVRGVSFKVKKGELLGIVGESGCGKSVTAFSALNQVKRPGKIDKGEVLFHGSDILKLSPNEMRKLRGSSMSMIFQEPLSALNPAFTVGWQIAESYKIQGIKSKKIIKEKTLDILNKVRLPEPELRMKEYPYQFSGGMRQRALIALALACQPELVFADEPTTALDVTVQAEILDLLQSLQQYYRMSAVLISHNLNLVGERCERILVFYAGKIVEEATALELFRKPSHPYTVGLLGSLLSINQSDYTNLTTISGEVPNMMQEIKGCSFVSRCKNAMPRCFETEPTLIEIAPAHFCSCHLFSEGREI
jgi:peptide/nickel transport system ATP-binding protein